jgi:L-rhamnose-H+ transport protein
MWEFQFLAGVVLTMLAGVLNGLFALPMKLMPRWRWEHTWLVYSIVGMAVFPWAAAFFFTPHLGQLICEAPLILICGFGFAWGVSAIAFGLALVRLGLGLGLALMLGLNAGLGSLVPMMILRPHSLGTRAGHFVLAGNAILIVGISLCAYAGSLREKHRVGKEGHPAGRSALLVGLLLAVVSAVLGSALNFSFAFTGGMQNRAVELGASPAMASMSIWALTVSSGFLVNAGYCLWKIGRAGWGYFAMPHSGPYWFGGTTMGLLWFGGLIAYGIGGSKLGSTAAVIGWPVILGTSIITSNLTGWLTGEWRGTGWRCATYLVTGIAVILTSILVIAQGSAL